MRKHELNKIKVIQQGDVSTPIRSARHDVRHSERSTQSVRSRGIYLLFAVLFAFSSCTEKIDIKLKSSDIRLVVEGGINFDSCYVILSTTMDYFSTNDDIPYVSDAHVTITEFDQNMQETKIFVLTENPNQKGHYFAVSDAYGKQRHTYRLNISTHEPVGGKTHYTADAFFPPIADRIDSIRAVWDVNMLMVLLTGSSQDTTSGRTGWNVEVFADDPDGENYYAMIVYKNDTALNDTLTRLLLFDNQMISQTNIGLRGVPMVFVSDSAGTPIQEGDKVTLEIRGVSKDYYRFINEFGSVYGGSNPMFGGTPANVRGNVSGGAIGYFWAHGSRKATDIATKSKRPTFDPRLFLRAE
jgi:hypothetical protein